MAWVGLKHVGSRDAHGLLRRGGTGWRGHLARQLKRGERRPTVATGKGDDLLERVVIEGEGALEAILRGDCAAHDGADGVIIERLELHHARA